MKVSFFEARADEQEILKQRLSGHKLSFFAEPLSEKNVSAAASSDIISITNHTKASPALLSALPNLKLVSTRTTGFDHIDLDSCKAKGIAVCNVPAYGNYTVAEYTFALLLMLSRKLHKAYLKSSKMDFSIGGLQGFELFGKTIGVIGSGRIGLNVIKIAKGFGMNAVAFDILKNNEAAKSLGFEYLPLNELLSKSDIITIHLPYSNNTHHLLNKGNISKIKRGAVLINTARGGIIETEALCQALDSGVLSGAALDVIEGEELLRIKPKSDAENSQLKAIKVILQKENVIFTSHIAFYTKEALRRIIETTAENIISFADGKPQNLVLIK